MMKITFDCRALAFAHFAMSSDEGRPYLQGVSVENHNNCIVTTATNGHVLLSACGPNLAPDDHETAVLTATECPDFEQFILERRTGKGLFSACMQSRAMYVTLQSTDRERRLYWETYNITEEPLDRGLVDLIDGPFPEWRRVVPAKVEKAPTNPGFMTARTVKIITDAIARGLRAPATSFRLVGAMATAPHLLQVRDPDQRSEFIGAVMPVTEEKEWKSVLTPEWALVNPATQSEASA